MIISASMLNTEVKTDVIIVGKDRSRV